MTKARSHAEHHEHIVKMAKPEKRACGGSAKRADGGKTAKKGKGTQVNVVVAPRGGAGQAGPAPASPGAMPGAAPAMPSQAPRPVAPPAPQAGPAGGLAALRGIGQPGVKTGGTVKRRASGGRVGKFDAGAGSAEGRLEKAAHEKSRDKRA